MPMRFIVSQATQEPLILPSTAKRVSMSVDDLKTIVHMRQLGHTYQDISSAVKRSQSTVRRAFLHWENQL